MKIVSLSNVYILSIHVMIFSDSVSSLRLQHKRKVKHLDFFMSKIKEITESEVKNIMNSKSNVGNFLISYQTKYVFDTRDKAMEKFVKIWRKTNVKS